MRIERPTETLQRFAKDANWLSQPIEIIANDLKSSANESRHEWDAFYYEEKNGHLFDPVRNQNIIGIDGNDETQRKINRELEDWFLSHDSGIAVRISPSGGMWNYPDEQIEIYKIAYNFPDLQKKLFCSFRQFRASLQNSEEIRQFIFTEEDSEEALLEIIKWVEVKSQKEVEKNLRNEKLRSDQSYYYATMLKSCSDPRFVFENMTQTGFLGEYSIGCGGSISTSSASIIESPILSSTNEIFDNLNGWHDGTCRNCGVNTWVGPCNICAPCASRM